MFILYYTQWLVCDSRPAALWNHTFSIITPLLIVTRVFLGVIISYWTFYRIWSATVKRQVCNNSVLGAKLFRITSLTQPEVRRCTSWSPTLESPSTSPFLGLQIRTDYAPSRTVCPYVSCGLPTQAEAYLWYCIPAVKKELLHAAVPSSGLPVGCIY
mgnify:CR=1 FL=1